MSRTGARACAVLLSVRHLASCARAPQTSPNAQHTGDHRTRATTRTPVEKVQPEGDSSAVPTHQQGDPRRAPACGRWFGSDQRQQDRVPPGIRRSRKLPGRPDSTAHPRPPTDDRDHLRSGVPDQDPRDHDGGAATVRTGAGLGSTNRSDLPEFQPTDDPGGPRVTLRMLLTPPVSPAI